MFPSTAQKSGTNDDFNLCFEGFLALQPPFSTAFETFCTPPYQNRCSNTNNAQNLIGPKVIFGQSSAGHFTVAQVNVLKG